MRIISEDIIEQKVYEAIEKAVCILPEDVVNALKDAYQKEHGIARYTLENLIKNISLAQQKMRPVCQDTGAAVFFVDIGEDVFVQGSIKSAINRAVSRAYTDFYLRKSMVKSPIERENTGDNTPAIIHFDIVPGDKITIHFMPKGFGSENKSALCMLTPADGVEGIERFVVETVKKAGSDPCPPILVGVGIGGTFELAALLSKKALLRKIGQRHSKGYVAQLEERLIDKINALGIGPEGFGGKTTVLDVFVEEYPTHIAGLPVAVNICCHVARHVSVQI
ncbi:hydro-lyase, Fe-S type, tartrate/fumarate subfamily, alpha subunit [Caldicellulosiruptor obsidiansis OB47]|uniref:Hydro-lyase, Fe-S type, tartrate/fumarate subfamily, alpha subunit n=1 Tax=Caldicellulosiruptor obsidiansis (strain ATCC BAA-2073 / JCM 16842 / OB47) TaxID=608506 RepID=D9THS3_CALOO|nr:fumarate hydratase [Caldicellulosiruptor obsidiansis]ADL43548.1 hydro-lyase, Fe-S type, tartrate/fumarate subfamily, alpha subunit [Caldicellulosiruptor obsidiansis OB47]